MKNNKPFLMMAVTLVLAMGYIAPLSAAAQAGDDQTRVIVGAWRTTVAPIPGDPTQFPAFPGLMTINQERTLTESDGSQLVPVPAGALGPSELLASGGHGVWQEAGARKYTIKFIQIVVNANDSTLFGTVTLQFTVKLNGDGTHFQGNGAFNFADGNGNTIFAGNEQISGDRITIQ